MSERKASTFELLARIERDKVSAVAQRHAALRSELEHLQHKIRELGDRIETEAFATSAETAPYVGAFISAIRAEIARCDHRRQQIQQDIEGLRSEIQTRFQQVKVFEIAEARRRHAVQTAHRKREERDRHEAVLLRHIRNGRPTL